MTYYTYYDSREELKGVIRELAAKKLKAEDTDLIEFATYTWDSGYCETCSYTNYEFAVLLNGEPIYDSREEGLYTGYSGQFGAFQKWLTS